MGLALRDLPVAFGEPLPGVWRLRVAPGRAVEGARADGTMEVPGWRGSALVAELGDRFLTLEPVDEVAARLVARPTALAAVAPAASPLLSRLLASLAAAWAFFARRPTR